MYEVKKQLISYNNPKTLLTSKGVVIHETANINDNAQMEYNYFNSGNRQASAHFFVDDKEIVQCIETKYIAWHAGRTANLRFWGIELCNTTNPIKFAEIWIRGVWLTSELLKSIDVKKVTSDNVLSHADISALYGETDHGDPLSYFRQYNKTMDNFREDVQKMINEKPVVVVPEWKKEGAQYLLDHGYLQDPHDPLEVLDIGLYGAIMKNRDEKLKK